MAELFKLILNEEENLYIPLGYVSSMPIEYNADNTYVSGNLTYTDFIYNLLGFPSSLTFANCFESQGIAVRAIMETIFRFGPDLNEDSSIPSEESTKTIPITQPLVIANNYNIIITYTNVYESRRSNYTYGGLNGYRKTIGFNCSMRSSNSALDRVLCTINLSADWFVGINSETGLTDPTTKTKLKTSQEFGTCVTDGEKIYSQRGGYISYGESPIISNPSLTRAIQYAGETHEANIGIIVEESEINTGETSTEGGGNGTYNYKSDEILVPTLPTFDGQALGIFTIFNLSIETFYRFSQALYNPSIINSVTNKLFGQPKDFIIKTAMYPFNIENKEGEYTIFLGDVALRDNQNQLINAPVVSKQFIEYNLGELTVENITDSFIDYSPFTQVTITIPFCGTYGIDSNYVFGHKLTLKSLINIFSGDCIYYLYSDSNFVSAYSCNIETELVVFNRDNGLVRNAITASNIIGMSVGGSILSGAFGAGENLNLSNVLGARAYEDSREDANKILAKSAIPSVSSFAYKSNDLSLGFNPPIMSCGNMGSGVSMMSIKSAFITIMCPRKSTPDKYASFVGYTSNIKAKLSELKGFTAVSNIHLKNISGILSSELEELETLLKSGVIL